MADIVTDEPPVVIQEPNPFWKENAEKLVAESISTIEETARQIIALASILEGLYFHAIAFSDLRGTLGGWMLFVYLLPVALWLASLLSAFWALFPGTYSININSSRSSKETFEEIVEKKHHRVKIAALFLAVSFLPLLIAVYFYLN
jgi:hypothetical protein